MVLFIDILIQVIMEYFVIFILSIYNFVHYVLRLSLPKEWQGLRDDELAKESGISGCIFVHASGFIGGNENYEGALAMARKSLQMCK